MRTVGDPPLDPPFAGRRPARRLFPPVYFILFNALLIVLDRLVPLALLVPDPWHLLGWVPITLGSTLAFLGVWQFRRHHTTLKPFHRSNALVTRGVYRLSRNPMYLGMVTAMVGVACIAGSASVWVVPPLFALTLWWRFIRPEEAMLCERFGQAYAAYRETVRRWI